MNRIYRSIRKAGSRTTVAASASGSGLAVRVLAASLMLAFGPNLHALPMNGAVSAGSASIAGTAGSMTIIQSTRNAAINWQSFSIGKGEAVRFVQPDSSSAVLNRVLGPDPSSIFGSLSANGKVFLVNPNGILFGKGASVNVGGLVASTLRLADGDFMAGKYSFGNAGKGTVLNQGSINAAGGHVALLGAQVSNEGVISARLGTVALAAGTAITIDVAGDGLLNVRVDQGVMNALVHNSGLIAADGGQVLMTAQAAGSLLPSAVNNTGVIQAQTIVSRNGTIMLLAGMQSGTVNVGGTLDASAPDGGAGGFIETSAAHVDVAENVKITTASARGATGTWLIDPQDFIIGSAVGNNITGATLSALLVTNSVVISTEIGTDAVSAGTPPVSSRFSPTVGVGDIFVNEAVAWTAAPSTTTLTMNAFRDVNVNAAITATNGNVVVCCGRDVNVNAAITTTNGSVLLSAGRNANLAATAAMTTTDGNIMICAGHDINVGAAMTLTRGSLIPAQSLGLPVGLVLSAGNDGSGPGVLGGTVFIAPGTPPIVVTGPTAPATVIYNPVSYAAPSDFSTNFTLSLGATLTQRMLVFAAGGDKAFDGTTQTALVGLKGAPAGVTLVAGPGSTANFDSAAAGAGKTVSFSGYTLAGADAANFALPVSCCGPVLARTSASITPAIPAIPVLPPLVTVPNIELAFASDDLPGLNLDVVDTGVRMPLVQVARATPTVVPPPAPEAIREVAPEVAAPVPAEAPPVRRPLKHDRN